MISSVAWAETWDYEFSKEESYLLSRAKASSYNDEKKSVAMAAAGNCFAYLSAAVSNPEWGVFIWDGEYLAQAYECGVKNFLPPDAVKVFSPSLPEGHPLGFEARAHDMGYTQEAKGLLDRALEAGSISAGIQLAHWELDGVLAPPNLMRANQYLRKVAEIMEGPPTEWSHWLEPVNSHRGKFSGTFRLIIVNSPEIEDADYWLRFLNNNPTIGVSDQALSILQKFAKRPVVVPALTQTEPSQPLRSSELKSESDESFIDFLWLPVAFGFFVFLFYIIKADVTSKNNEAPAETGSQSSPLIEPAPESPAAAMPIVSEPLTEHDPAIEVLGEPNGESKLGSNRLAIVVGAFFFSVVICASLNNSSSDNPAQLALASGVMQTISGGLLGFLIKLILDRSEGISPAAVGRSWAGWGIVLAAMSQASFFSTFDAEDFAKLIVAVVGVGGTAFAAGWVMEKLRQTDKS